MSVSASLDQQSVSKIASMLLLQAGIEADNLKIIGSDAGGNNRVFILGINGERYLFKNYFMSCSDTRDRLKHEWGFLNYAEAMQIACVPRPIVFSEEYKVGIYQYVDGNKISRESLNSNHLRQAVDFIKSLNLPERIQFGQQLDDASEACFNLHNHIDLVEGRVQRLNKIDTHEDFQDKLAILVKEIIERFNGSKARLFAVCKEKGIDVREDLEMQERCISPSDFGFHNALLCDGKLVFLDFEYAGWDDPAKLIADFFCQPEIPVPIGYFETFADGCLSYTGVGINKHKQRASILLPLYKLKWCCIMLNEFLPDTWERRKFARDLKHQHYIDQITKVENSLNEMKIH